MKIDRTILDLSDVFKYISLAKILSILESFTKSRKLLQKTKAFLIADTYDFNKHVEIVAAITEQLEYLDKNIKTLQVAMLAHESKCIEKRIGLGKLQNVGLN
jgi:hypothetical protein